MPDPEMMCPGECTYRMSVDMSWAPQSHPIDFPMEPMGFVFPFWTVAHNKQCASPTSCLVPLAHICFMLSS